MGKSKNDSWPKKKRIVVQAIALVLGLMATSVVDDKAVALCPIEYDTVRGAIDARCSIDPANDLYSPSPPLFLRA